MQSAMCSTREKGLCCTKEGHSEGLACSVQLASLQSQFTAPYKHDIAGVVQGPKQALHVSAQGAPLNGVTATSPMRISSDGPVAIVSLQPGVPLTAFKAPPTWSCAAAGCYNCQLPKPHA